MEDKIYRTFGEFAKEYMPNYYLRLQIEEIIESGK
jgi:hypothetical protein